MRRPFTIEETDGVLEALRVERSDDHAYAALIYCAPDEADDGVPSEGEVFLADAKALGVNVGALVRDSCRHQLAIGGHAIPFDACTWPQALEYGQKALPSGTEAAQYEWAIRYMWCLELSEPHRPALHHPQGVTHAS